MNLFENLVLLLFIAAVLLAASRRLGLPYPTLLCLAGVAVVARLFPELATHVIRVRPATAVAAGDAKPESLAGNARRDLRASASRTGSRTPGRPGRS
jgi:hypothetical protein